MKYALHDLTPLLASAVMTVLCASAVGLQWPVPSPQAVTAAAQAGERRSLLLITAGPGLDYRKLGPAVAIHDHYYESEGGTLRHRLLAVPRNADLSGLEALPLTYRVLDPRPAAGGYAWVSGAARNRPGIERAGGRVLLERAGSSHLVALPEPGGERRLAEVLPSARVRAIDLAREIRPDWIAPGAPRVDLRRRAAGRNAQVEALLAGVSDDDCRRLLEQLTGATPITLGTESRLIRTRFAGGDDIVPLTNWLAEEFRQMGLDARIDTFPSSQGRDLPQVEATLVGADLKDEFVLITAHLDAVRGTPGADDNASGIAAMVGAARRLAGQTLRRSVRFVAFNDEEQGLVGSVNYARRLASEGARSRASSTWTWSPTTGTATDASSSRPTERPKATGSARRSRPAPAPTRWP